MRQNLELRVSEVIDHLIEKFSTKVRVKNDNEVIGSSNARVYKVLKNTLGKFVSENYKKSFSSFLFQDIDIRFLTGYITFLEKRAEEKGKGERTTVPQRLKGLHSVFNCARKMGVKNVDLSIFENVSEQMKMPEVAPPLILSADTMRKIEEIDRSFLNKREQFHLDLFLFSYYAGGISCSNMAYLTHNCIENSIITYDKMNTNITLTIEVSSLAQEIINRYQNECYLNYVLPIFSAKHKTDVQRRGRIERMGLNINKTLIKVCKHIKFKKRIKLHSAEVAFISKQLKADICPYQISQNTGHTIKYIQKFL